KRARRSRSKSPRGPKASKHSTLRLPDATQASLQNRLITMHKSYRHTGPHRPVFFCFKAKLPGCTNTKRFQPFVYLMALVLCQLPWTSQAQAMLLPTAQLQIGPHRVQAEIAATDASRSYGLMNRASLPANHG